MSEKIIHMIEFLKVLVQAREAGAQNYEDIKATIAAIRREFGI
jgi:hypothetical protein